MVNYDHCAEDGTNVDYSDGDDDGDVEYDHVTLPSTLAVYESQIEPSLLANFVVTRNRTIKTSQTLKLSKRLIQTLLLNYVTKTANLVIGGYINCIVTLIP